MKEIFFTTMTLNISLHSMYVSTTQNPADAPSRSVFSLDCTLHPDLWRNVQREFSGLTGHTCDLMALDSNAIVDLQRNPLPHFTRHSTPASGCGCIRTRFITSSSLPMCFLHCFWWVRYYISSRLITARAPCLPWIYIHGSTGGHSSSTMPPSPVYLWLKATIRLC